MFRPTHWLIVEHDGIAVGQIPLNPEYGQLAGRRSSPREDAVRLKHIELLEQHKDMALGSKIKISPDLYLQRTSFN